MASETTTTTDRLGEEVGAALRERMRGAVLGRDDPGFEPARQVWNGFVDRHPVVFARCEGVADVVAAVEVARRFRPPVSIRGGGHQVAGGALCDDGLVIDVGPMHGVHVNPAERTVRVEAGARWADVDRATQLFGLVVPGGEVSVTGVAGYTLGGGLGLLQRKFGLACDNLRSVEVVTADGLVRTASATENPDLFWAARGGGRGIGVVTSFEFDLHPLGPQVVLATVFYSYDQARDVLRAWRDYTASAPREVSPEYGLWSVPPAPAIPAELHGQKVVVVGGLYAGDPAEAGKVLGPLAGLGGPLIDATATAPYTAVQERLDPLFADGERRYWKSHFLDALPDEAVEAVVALDADRPTPQCLTILRTLGGAIDDVAPADSAYPHRGALYNLSIDGNWTDPAMDARLVGWVRAGWDSMRPYSTGGVYVNFAGMDADAGAEEVYGGASDRLAQVRQAYDPDGLFADAAGRH
ncbi:FAD-binding oxidoreductase [Kineococcus sp. SYSU DK003]|uniref:FAD-binding oxidoreductase n=1 Tax=Kineococcus sp. SYSU DK003 TaxID=3383124 RepID=UPI003D7C57EE